MTWHLDNVYERNAEFPYTFYIPSKAVMQQLKTGDLVKLRFIGESETENLAGERMWVEITERNGGSFKGLLTNQPYDLKGLKAGQEILFGAEHICDTEYKDPASIEWDFYFDVKAVVSNDVLDRREFNFMLRDHPREEHDSGWSILTGFEDDEFANNPDNFQLLSIGVILNMDDSILKFIHEDPLCAYERDNKGEFYKIEDYDWDSYLNG